MKTGTQLFWMMGLTVGGKPAATVITSSPGLIWRSPSRGEVRQEKAQRLAEEPELTSEAPRTPKKRANWRSNWVAKRPGVSEQSREASMRLRRSEASRTLPETGTGEVPGSKAFLANCWLKNCSGRAR